MKKFIGIALVILLGAACSSTKGLKQHKYIPSEFHSLRFDMSMDTALKIRPAMKKIEEVDFRTVYMEEIGKDGIETAVYYFGTNNNKPLYEMIFIYESEAKRDLAADKLLGKRNFDDENGKAWMYKSGEGYKIKAWTFENKLIITGMIKGTEWGEPAE